MPEEKDFSELLAEFTEQEKLYNFEGESGLKRFEKVIEAIGYKAHGFRFGNLIEVFLADNPGAVAALIEFIEEWGDKGTEWKESLESNLNYVEEEENEDANDD